MDAKPAIMLIGLGHLGSAMLELFARDEDIGPIAVCDLPDRGGEARCNLARLGALAQGCRPEIRFRAVDVTVEGALAEAVDEVEPDLVLSTVSMQTWWLTELLPSPQRERLAGARFGAWLPIHFPLTRRVMAELAGADYRGITLTAPFPDVVNCMLGRIGLAPLSGVGNLDEMVPKLQHLIADRAGIPYGEIVIYLVAHHAFEPAVFSAAPPDRDLPPCFLRVEHDGREITDEVEAHALLREPCPLPDGPAWSWLTAGSALRLVKALFTGTPSLLHAPAPGGLPGGYPVLVSSGGMELAPIEGLSAEEAVAINEASHPFDGIESIEEDGTARFTAATSGIMREELGFDCPTLHPDEAEDRGRELIRRFREYAVRHGVDLP
jgi:hypothetical protein